MPCLLATLIVGACHVVSVVPQQQAGDNVADADSGAGDRCLVPPPLARTRSVTVPSLSARPWTREDVPVSVLVTSPCCSPGDLLLLDTCVPFCAFCVCAPTSSLQVGFNTQL